VTDRICVVCGETFATAHPRKVLCSAECRAERANRLAVKRYRRRAREQALALVEGIVRWRAWLAERDSSAGVERKEESGR
jgi:hypothetical protein